MKSAAKPHMQMSCTWKALRCAGDRRGSPNQALARLGDLQTLGQKEKAASHSNPFTFPLHGRASRFRDQFAFARWNQSHHCEFSIFFSFFLESTSQYHVKKNKQRGLLRIYLKHISSGSSNNNPRASTGVCDKTTVRKKGKNIAGNFPSIGLPC